MLKIANPLAGKDSKTLKLPLRKVGKYTYHGFLLIMVMSIGSNLSAIRQERSNVFVQTAGETIPAERVNPLHRTDGQLKTYVRKWFKTAFTWNNKKPGHKDKQGGAYPAGLWDGSFAITLGTRDGWLQQVHDRYAQQLPLNAYIAGNMEAVVELTRDPMIEQVEEGLWRITMIADRVHMKQDGSSQFEAMKLNLTLQAVPHSSEEENNALGQGKETDTPNALIHKWRKDGLKIVLIEVK